MKKTILAMMTLMLAITLIFTGCSTENGAETPPPIIEAAETNAGADHISIEDEDEDTATATDTESTNDTEEAILDDDTPPQNPFVGTYRNSMGGVTDITITDDGRLQHRELDLDIYNIQENGSILVHEYVDEEFGDVWLRLFIYPVGVSLSAWSHETNSFVETDDTRLRLFMTFTDVPDVRTNVYYKVEPLRLLNAGAYSFLPRAGYTYEFALFGIVGGTGREWSSSEFVYFEDIGGGEVKSSAGFVYFETTTGLYRRWAESTEAELVISFPITQGATFIGANDWQHTIVDVDLALTTEAGIFENVVAIQDSIDRNMTYYAPGFGRVRVEFTRSIHELVRISR